MRTFFHFAFARLQVVNYLVSLVLLLSPRLCLSQNFPHGQAHAHNDYEHPHPLFDALKNGFTSVEADVHLRKGDLSVGHNSVTDQSPRLRRLYLAPLDSLLRSGSLPSGFCLMIDIKTDAEETYQALKEDLKKYPALVCTTKPCALKIVLSGNRPLKTMVGAGTQKAVQGRQIKSTQPW